MPAPNVILIMTDNQQAATLGCYGNSEMHSPNIDALAASGVQFERAFCANSFCSPCRASTLTGMLPSQHGIHSWIDDRNMADWPKGWHALSGLSTLPEEMQKLGYRTGLFGKYHLGETVTPGPGWDDFVSMEHGHVRSFYDNQIMDNGKTYVEPNHAVDFFTDKALAFMEAQTDPFFAYLPFPAPYGHWPACNDGMRNRFAQMYDDCPMVTIPRQGISAEAVTNFNMVNAGSGGGLDFSMLMRAPNHLPALRNYYSQITMIDDAVGRIAAAHPDALIIFTSDHGLSLGHHGFWGHGASTYPSNLHLAAHSIPMIMRHPTGIPPHKDKHYISNMDLYATVIDYAGGTPDTSLPSRSFAPAIKGEEMPDLGRDEVYSEQEETRSIRTGDWMYLKRFRRNGAPDLPDALYNTVIDPGEKVNLVCDPDHVNIAHDLSARIDAFFAQYARPEADLWHGGKPIQNTMLKDYWKSIWGKDWGPVYSY